MTDVAYVPDPNTPGDILHARSTQHYWHGRGALSIKSFVSGRALYQVGGGSVAVGEHEYLVLNSGQEYSITVDSTTPVESFCVFFAPGFPSMVHGSITAPSVHVLDDPGFRSPIPHFVERTYSHDDLVSPVLARLRTLHCHDARDEGSLHEAFHDLMTRLLCLQGRVEREIEHVPALRAATREELYRRLHLAKEYAAACFDQPITLDDIARVAGLSPKHLLRTFRSVFGQTPYQYVVAKRISHAQRLLRHSDMPITEICFAVGWQSHDSFSFLFRRRTGMSPRAYRRQFGDIREARDDTGR